MPWVDIIPSVLVALAVLLWPTPLLVGILRLPPLASVAVGPPIAILVLVASAIVADALGATWGWPWVLAIATVLMVGLAAARWWVRRGRAPVPRRGPGSPRVLGTYLLGMVLGGAALGPTILDALVGPDALSQRYDNVFHLNAIRLAASGHGSPFSLAPVSDDGFYPTAWHDWVAFVIQVSGTDVLVATQAATLAIVLVVWPLSLAWFTETVLQPGVAGRLALGPLALSSVSFPLMLTAWGTLYPNLLGIAITPVFLAAAWDAFGRREQPALGLGSVAAITVLTGSAMALAHPNAALSGGLLLLPVALVALWPALRRADLRAVRGSAWWTASVAAFAVGFPVAWVVLGRVIADWSVREPFTTGRHAFAEVLTGTALGRPAIASLTIGLVLGLLVAAFTPRLRVLLVSFLLASTAYFAAAALQTSPAVLLFTAPYSSDPYRIAAMGTLVVIPLAVLGWDTLADILGHKLPPGARVALALALAAALATVSANSEGMRHLHAAVRAGFVADADALILTPDERSLIERLPQTTEPDAVLVVNPFQGGSLAYALADRRVTHYYMNTVPSAAEQYLERNLRHASTDPAVCDAVASTGSRYALVLEPYEMSGPTRRTPSHAGLVGLDHAAGFERVDAEGQAALYRITACG